VAARTLGIVGGIGPESTLDYYRRLIDGTRDRVGDRAFPAVLINSIDGRTLIPHLVARDIDRAAPIVADAIAPLAAAGAGLGLIASVATHSVFAAVAPAAPIPLLSIVDAVADAARAARVGRPALLAPRVTSEGTFFRPPFERAGIELVVPDATGRAWIDRIYFDELVRGEVRDSTRAELAALTRALAEREHVDGVILGGTELSLLVREPTFAGLQVLDAVAIHVSAALDWLLAP